MLEVIRIPNGLGIEKDLFLFKTDGSNGDEGELLFMTSEEEVGQYAGDIYNWDDGDPESYTFNGNLEELFDLLKAKSLEDESSEWLGEYV